MPTTCCQLYQEMEFSMLQTESREPDRISPQGAYQLEIISEAGTY